MKLNKFFKAFKYPFSFINDNTYKLINITFIMFNNNFKAEDIDLSLINFPKDIVKVYYYEKGINDKKPWQFIGKIKYEDTYKFIYYIGECDYTGFDCQGFMKLYISKSLNKILNYAVPTTGYSSILDKIDYKKINFLIEKYRFIDS